MASISNYLHKVRHPDPEVMRKVEDETIQKAQKILNEHPDIQPRFVLGEPYWVQESDITIHRLYALYFKEISELIDLQIKTGNSFWTQKTVVELRNANLGKKSWELNEFYQKLFELAKDFSQTPYSSKDVIEKIVRIGSISFTVSLLSIADTQQVRTEHIKAQHSEKVHKTLVHAFSCQENYLYRTAFVFPQFYHWMRGGYHSGPSPHPSALRDSNTEVHLYHSCEPQIESKWVMDKKHVKQFYEKGNPLYDLRKLYNHFCKRVVFNHLEKNELKQVNSRYYHWIKPDKKSKKFRCVPDSTPN